VVAQALEAAEHSSAVSTSLVKPDVLQPADGREELRLGENLARVAVGEVSQ
jgi:hypothetical protein